VWKCPWSLLCQGLLLLLVLPILRLFILLTLLVLIFLLVLFIVVLHILFNSLPWFSEFAFVNLLGSLILKIYVFYWFYCFCFFPDKVLNMFKLCSNMFSFFHPNKGDKNRTICLKNWIAIQISINGPKGRIVNTSAPPKTLFDFTTWIKFQKPIWRYMKPRIPGCTLTLRVNSDAILVLAVRGVTI
jgi:hypothetical protein